MQYGGAIHVIETLPNIIPESENDLINNRIIEAFNGDKIYEWVFSPNNIKKQLVQICYIQDQYRYFAVDNTTNKNAEFTYLVRFVYVNDIFTGEQYYL